MNNKTQQKFDQSVRVALAIRPQSKPRKLTIDLSSIAEPGPLQDRSGWKLRLDPNTGATIWGPAD